MTVPSLTDLRTTTDLRESVLSPTDLRTVSRITEATGITEAVIRGTVPRATDRTGDSSRTEEGMQVADLRATDKTDFREMADRAGKAVRATGVVLALIRAATAVSTVLRAITEEMADREPDTEIRIRARALQRKLRQRIWKSGVRMKRDAQAAWRRINAPERIISTRKTKH